MAEYGRDLADTLPALRRLTRPSIPSTSRGAAVACWRSTTSARARCSWDHLNSYWSLDEQGEHLVEDVHVVLEHVHSEPRGGAFVKAPLDLHHDSRRYSRKPGDWD